MAVFNTGDVISTDLCNDLVNDIGAEGTRALAESLKQNTTLTNLNLRGMPEVRCVAVF